MIGQINGGATCWLNSIYQSLISTPLTHILNEAQKNPQLMETSREINAYLAHIFFNIPRANAQFAFCQQFAGKTPDALYAAGLRDFKYPLATCALLESSEYAALHLFGALVIYCAATGARPAPEYRAIGEVNPAMIETVIGALCWENTPEIAAQIRELFAIKAMSRHFCVEHFREPLSLDNFKPASQQCLHIIPTSRAGAFEANIRASVDVCERECACGTSATFSVEIREEFPQVLMIFADDSIARGLHEHPVSTAMYRHATGSICIPNKITIGRAEYLLVAQICQEGGHFTAIVSRGGKIAHISDRAVRILENSPTISPGVCMLFYVRAEQVARELFNPAILSRVVSDWQYQNRDIAIINAHSCALIAPCTGDIIARESINVREFYTVAMRTQFALSYHTLPRESSIAFCFGARIGAHIAVFAMKQTTSEDLDACRELWTLWKSARDDAGNECRAQIDALISPRANLCAKDVIARLKPVVSRETVRNHEVSRETAHNSAIPHEVIQNSVIPREVAHSNVPRDFARNSAISQDIARNSAISQDIAREVARNSAIPQDIAHNSVVSRETIQLRAVSHEAGPIYPRRIARIVLSHEKISLKIRK